jgi:hypothetical protein
MAAAEARSGFPDTLRCAARGSPLPLVALSGAPLAARLVPAAPGARPCTVEWRLGGAEVLTKAGYWRFRKGANARLC